MALEFQFKEREMQMEYDFKERESQRQDAREREALQVQAHMQDREVRTKEAGVVQKGEEIAANKEQKKPVRAYNVKRGPDGRAASLEVVR
jgi:hypothetical protein